MANKREKLESRATELGLSFVPGTTDDELQQLINDFENPPEEQPTEPVEEFSSDTRFFKSKIAGLSIQYGDEPERDEAPTTVRFTPFEFFDEKRGERYTVGFLATEEPDALEVLAEDPNVEEIDSQDEYLKQRGEGTRARY